MDILAKEDYCYVAMPDSSDVINSWHYTVPALSATDIIGAKMAIVEQSCVDLKA